MIASVLVTGGDAQVGHGKSRNGRSDAVQCRGRQSRGGGCRLGQRNPLRRRFLNRILVTSLPAKDSVIDVGELCAGRRESWREIELVRIIMVDGWVGREGR